MQFVSRTTKDNEYQEKADYFLIAIDLEYAQTLLRQRQAAIDFLYGHTNAWNKYLGEVRLAWQGGLCAFEHTSGEDGASEEIDDLFAEVDEASWFVAFPDGFEPDDERCARLGGERVVFYADGRMRLYAYDDHSGKDIVSEEFDLNLLQSVVTEATEFCDQIARTIS